MIIRPYYPWLDYYVDAAVDDFLRALFAKPRRKRK
jgi:hypothetical protein